MKKFLLLSACIISLSAFTQSIGIGTTTPNTSAMLDVQSTAKGFLMPRMTQTQRNAITSPATGLMIYQTDNTPGCYYYNGTGWIQVSTGGATSYWSPNGTHIFNNNSGNIGIGTSSPQSKLHIFNGSAGGVLPYSESRFTIEYNDHVYMSFLTPDSKESGMLFGINSNNVHGSIIYNNSSVPGGIQFRTNGNVNRMVIDQNGNVGVGTTSPVAKLNVAGNIAIGNSAVLPIGSSGNIFGGLRVSHAAGAFPATTFYDLCADGNAIQCRTSDIGGNYSEAPLVLNKFGGNVGIGLTTPSSPLSFPNVLGNKISLWHAGPNNDFGIGLNAGVLQFFTAGQDKIAFGWGNTNVFNETMSFYSGSGQLGIGTTNVGTYRLAVNGSIRSKEVRVESGWADYVFDHKYKLPSLTEVEKYIQQYKHLPDIPAADIIQKDGLAVGEMQTRMMQKIEELTLYIIDLQKQINDLEKKCIGHENK